MTIGSIGQSVNTVAASTSYSPKAQKAAPVKTSSSGSEKDTVILSESAKDLAALKAGKSSQEEATESVTAKLKEKMAGGK